MVKVLIISAIISIPFVHIFNNRTWQQQKTHQLKELKMKDHFKALGAKWASLGLSEKAAYLENFAKMRDENKNKYNELIKDLPEQKIIEIKKTLAEKKVERGKYLTAFRIRRVSRLELLKIFLTSIFLENESIFPNDLKISCLVMKSSN